MKLIDRLERKMTMANIKIPNLMNYIVFGMGAAWLANFIFPGLTNWLYFSPALIAKGQVWRIITFIFMPPNSSPLFIIISLYFYWMIGSALENKWGSTRFTLYYAIGVLGSLISGLITGYAVNDFLNLSLFFAFAALWPDYQIMLFFFLPVKIKYLALLDAALFVWQFIVGGFSVRMAIIFSLINFALFMGGDLIKTIRTQAGYLKTRRQFRRNMR